MGRGSDLWSCPAKLQQVDLFSSSVLAPGTSPLLAIRGTTYRLLGHQIFVVRHAFILTMPWCPSWARRKTSPPRISRITILEPQKTSLPNTHSSSLTQKHAGVLQRDQSPRRMCCLRLAIFGSLSENQFHLFRCQSHRDALPDSHIDKVSCLSAGVFGSNLIESWYRICNVCLSRPIDQFVVVSFYLQNPLLNTYR